jgi:thiosulfate/3-mercaptopyruvate sulfurtransferase
MAITPRTITAAPTDIIVDAAWVEANRTRPGVVLLDARPADQYSGAVTGPGIERPGHIPGARNIPWAQTVVSAERPLLRSEAELRALFEAAGARPGDLVVAYCQSGMQGSFLYFVARRLGYEARLYDGSFADWSARSELPVATAVGVN